MCLTVDKTIKQALHKLVVQHGRHLAYLKSMFEEDYIIPTRDKAVQRLLENYYRKEATSRNYAFQWHQLSQTNYETRIMFFRDALCDYENYTGVVHKLDADYPELSEIPRGVPSGGWVAANKRLQINNPCNKPHLILMGVKNIDPKFKSTQCTNSMVSNKFHLLT